MTNEEYYLEQYKILNNVGKEAIEKRISFFQYLLLVSASIVGIIISLHTANSQYLYIRLVFFLSTVLLSLGTLSLAVVLYDFSNFQELLRQDFRDEFQDAIQKGRQCNIVSRDLKKRTSILEKTSYYLLALGFVLQITYTGLLAFEPTKTEKRELIIK